MGLDNFACTRDSDGGFTVMDNSLFNSNRLCSGICAMNNNSFRGKVYNDYVEYVTGQTLYASVIPEEVVKKMADKLTKFVDHFLKQNPDHLAFEVTESIYGVDLSEAEMLSDWFNAVANNNGVILGWW